MTYKSTVYAGFTGYTVQAVVNNLVPLLFVLFQERYALSLPQVTFLITANFLVQLLTDILSAAFVDKIGWRVSIVAAHICSALGFAMLAFLPDLLPDPFAGILLSIAVYAVGGGLLEVLVSPIVEACPTKNKETVMSLLHSFYCWGYVLVVLLSTVFFAVCGIHRWKLLVLLWALLPLGNGILFLRVPLYRLSESGAEDGKKSVPLYSQGLFWILLAMMLCAGASELAVSQWASVFAEQGLGVNKTAGDLAGPMAFALLMGASRLFYGRFGSRISLDRFMLASCLLCVLSYFCIAFVPVPAVALLFCAVCGFSVGILWPGTFSKAAASVRGGTAMFAFLALAGDLGCAAGPSLAGFAASAAGGNLRMGILSAVVFPVLMLAGVLLLRRVRPSGR